MERKGMVIDLKHCVGCQSCTSMCKLENFTPPGIFFTRVLTREYGKYPAVRKEFWPVQCNHCAEPACVDVCPTGASAQREDGIVTVDASKCIGCRYCMMACPYRVRFYLDGGKSRRRYYFEEGATPYELHGEKVKDYQTGTVIKCDFCVTRLERGLQPACVVTCSSKARYFGDLDDPESDVSRLIAARGGFQQLPEKGTDPSIHYLR
jgi:molybdopterin-containing oxidoreductase family iron-sulfur binding subunit